MGTLGSGKTGEHRTRVERILPGCYSLLRGEVIAQDHTVKERKSWGSHLSSSSKGFSDGLNKLCLIHSPNVLTVPNGMDEAGLKIRDFCLQ